VAAQREAGGALQVAVGEVIRRDVELVLGQADGLHGACLQPPGVGSVEDGPAPRHPYARLLADAVPDLDRGGLDLPAVALEEAGPGGAEAGCAFASRCPRRQSICAQVPPLIDGLDARAVACFFPLEDA
jgi:oligopeptide/dipeptide ABC transporter ATP-binding protein